MTQVATTALSSTQPRRFHDAEEWLHALGDIPLFRVVMDPPPGTATEQDLLRLVERDDRLVELIDGTLVEKPGGRIESQIAVVLLVALGNFINPRKLGSLAGEAGTLRMKSGRIRIPDISFVSAADVPPGTPPNQPVPMLPPTLAVEIVSESNMRREMQQKAKEYFESGSRLVWMVYPNTRTVEVFEQFQEQPARVLTEADVLDGGAVLPGFSIGVAEIFEPLSRGF